MNDNKPIYLGDGVYLQPQDYQLRLFTSDGIIGTNNVYLDPHTAEALYEELKKWLGK